MKDLIERIEAADGPDQGLDAEIMKYLGWRFTKYGAAIHPDEYLPSREWPSYTSSIDAAMTLVGECDELKIMRGKRYSSAVIYKDGESFDGWATTSALALCAAALRARNGQE